MADSLRRFYQWCPSFSVAPFQFSSVHSYVTGGYMHTISAGANKKEREHFQNLQTLLSKSMSYELCQIKNECDWSLKISNRLMKICRILIVLNFCHEMNVTCTRINIVLTFPGAFTIINTLIFFPRYFGHDFRNRV